MRLRVVGEFPDLRAGPYIYIFNHTSMLDPMITVAAIPEHIGAIGKAEQFSMPLWGTLIRRWGAVPIQRSDLPNAIQSLDQVEAAIAGGLSLLISPEGTRSPDGSLLPFKKGPFHLAANTGVPMVPMAITGAFAAKQRGSWILRPATLTVQVGPPIWVGDAEDSTPEGLRDLAHRRLLAMLAPQA
jgi:1-acyl-sn-glycerol-3-phosphate acyltransferase